MAGLLWSIPTSRASQELYGLVYLHPVELTYSPVVPAIEYSSDVLSAIAKCESGGQQFYSDGSLVTNKNYTNEGVFWSTDIGLFQINDYYHLESSKRLGFDIYTETGNTAYAEYLFNIAGTSPWSASMECWK